MASLLKQFDTVSSDREILTPNSSSNTLYNFLSAFNRQLIEFLPLFPGGLGYELGRLTRMNNKASNELSQLLFSNSLNDTEDPQKYREPIVLVTRILSKQLYNLPYMLAPLLTGIKDIVREDHFIPRARLSFKSIVESDLVINLSPFNYYHEIYTHLLKYVERLSDKLIDTFFPSNIKYPKNIYGQTFDLDVLKGIVDSLKSCLQLLKSISGQICTDKIKTRNTLIEYAHRTCKDIDDQVRSSSLDLMFSDDAISLMVASRLIRNYGAGYTSTKKYLEKAYVYSYPIIDALSLVTISQFDDLFLSLDQLKDKVSIIYKS